MNPVSQLRTAAAEPDDGLLSVSQVLARVSITYRQLEFWSTTNRIKYHGEGGSGHHRRYEPSEVQVIELAMRHLACGFTVDTAIAFARRIVERADMDLAAVLSDLHSLVRQDKFE